MRHDDIAIDEVNMLIHSLLVTAGEDDRPRRQAHHELAVKAFNAWAPLYASVRLVSDRVAVTTGPARMVEDNGGQCSAMVDVVFPDGSRAPMLLCTVTLVESCVDHAPYTVKNSYLSRSAYQGLEAAGGSWCAWFGRWQVAYIDNFKCPGTILMPCMPSKGPITRKEFAAVVDWDRVLEGVVSAIHRAVHHRHIACEPIALARDILDEIEGACRGQ